MTKLGSTLTKGTLASLRAALDFNPSLNFWTADSLASTLLPALAHPAAQLGSFLLTPWLTKLGSTLAV